MSTAPSEAHRSLVAMTLRTFELIGIESAAKLIADSEARAVEAKDKELSDMHDKMLEYKSHYQYREQRVVELEQSLTKERERVRVLEEALKSAAIEHDNQAHDWRSVGDVENADYHDARATKLRAALAATAEHAKEGSK